ncbi:MAG: hypothetical protein Q9209_002870 [Squamulea sp. 1 TL-2023]
MPGLKAPLSEEFIIESESDSDAVHTEKSTKKPDKSAANATRVSTSQKSTQPAEFHSDSSGKRKYESPSILSSDSEASYTSVTSLQGIQPEGESGSASGSGSSRSEEEDDQSTSDDNASVELPSKAAPATSRSKLPERAIEYNPPLGFEACTITRSSARRLQRAFGKEALQGKQIWYITTPAGVPISSIREVPIRKVAEGNSIISYKSDDYGLFTEADSIDREKLLLLPSLEDNDYRPAGIRIEKTLHLQQIAKLPASAHKEGALPNGVTNTPKTHVKIVRQQPENLRMRYRPFGDLSSDEDTDGGPKFKMPSILSVAQSSRAKKPSADIKGSAPPNASVQPKNSPEKTKLTSRVSEALKLAHLPSPNVSVEGTRLESQSNHQASSSPKPKETPEEKARRRAERKKRKETKNGEHRQTVDQLEELPVSKKYEEKLLTVNGGGDAIQNPPEPSTSKPKRKKRKSEAIDDV